MMVITSETLRETERVGMTIHRVYQETGKQLGLIRGLELVRELRAAYMEGEQNPDIRESSYGLGQQLAAIAALSSVMALLDDAVDQARLDFDAAVERFELVMRHQG